MSQQGAGADDWWQKLYEDPDAGPETDPRDTLDHRFRSAAVMVAPPVSGEGAILPGQRREPVRPEPVGPDPVSPGPVSPDRPPPVVAEVPVVPEDWSPAEGAYGESLRPPPRDPRAGGQTWYALGDVSVPPALPADPQPAPAVPAGRPVVAHLGDRPPTYAAEPVALPAADPAGLDALTPDTVLEGAQYGGYTLRAASLRGDSARFRGEPRRDFLLTARFGAGPDALVLEVLAGGVRAAAGAG
ncbi:hypothetical protein ACFXA9_10055, partial [Streptomyces sp. NPDC059411]